MTRSQIYSWKEQKMMIRAGALTAKEVAASCLERIRRDNPKINALSQVLESSALETADQVDRCRLQGELAGLCVVVKDMIDVNSAVCDGGLGYLAGRTAHTDADIVTSLKFVIPWRLKELSGDPAADVPQPWPPDSPRSPWERTAVAASAFRLPAAVSSDSNPHGVFSRSRGFSRLPLPWIIPDC
jgi:hypothetical protein